jgi:uncharacterized protein (DUF2164 family)
MTIRRKWDISSKEQKKKCIDALITYLESITDDPVGMIAAEEILDIVAEAIGPDIYNSGVEDAKKLLASKFTDIEIDLDMLRQS